MILSILLSDPAVIPTSVLGASEPETGSEDKPFCLRVGFFRL